MSDIELERKMSTKMGVIATKANSQTLVPNFETVVYKSHKSVANPNKLKPPDADRVHSDSPMPTNVDMKKARFEVMKFAMSGFTSKRKEKAQIELAIKLGAKPPKNKFKNYKELLALKKKQAKQKEAREKLQQLGKNSIGKSNVKTFKRKRRKETSGILDVYGKPTLKTSDERLFKKK